MLNEKAIHYHFTVLYAIVYFIHTTDILFKGLQNCDLSFIIIVNRIQKSTSYFCSLAPYNFFSRS